MNLLHITRESLRSLAAHRTRTLLMALGTVIGVAALMVTLAIEKGTQIEIARRVDSFGTRLIKINAGGGKGYTKPQPNVTTLRMEDAEAIRSSQVGWDIVTSVSQRGNMSVRGAGQQSQAGVYAVDADWHEAMDWPTAQGDGISGEDVATLARVCVLGSGLAKALFGNENPVGSEILIENVRFQVKGLLVHHDVSPGGEDENNRAVIPLTTGLRRLFNQNHLSYIRVRMKSPDQVSAASESIRQLMHNRHHIVPPQEDDFSIVTSGVVAQTARGIVSTVVWLMAALAGLALLISGTVMMNIMLVSVSQRRVEIGLRRALGATRGAILSQFLGEALVVTVAGAAVGAILGWAVDILLPHYTKLKVVVSWEPFVVGAACAVLLGLGFGILPARRATALPPAEVLR